MNNGVIVEDTGQDVGEDTKVMAKRTNLKGTRRGGFYWKELEPYLSVTEVLKQSPKPGLDIWKQIQVYLAVVKDPSISQAQALAAPYSISREAIDRGLTVHSLVEAYKHTKEHIDGIPEKFRGYAKAFYKWIETNNVTIIAQERSVFNDRHRLAGTLDLLATVNEFSSPFVLDIKTGKDIYEEAFIQCSAYRFMLTEKNVKTMGIGVVLLHEDGEVTFKYKTEPQTLKRYEQRFFMLKKQYELERFETLRKLGYEAPTEIHISY